MSTGKRQQLNPNYRVGSKTFKIVSAIAMALAVGVATLSIVGVVFTGFYPGIAVLSLLALVPIASKRYVKNVSATSGNFQKTYYATLTVINLILIFVVLWMTFVILVDRVFGKIL